MYQRVQYFFLKEYIYIYIYSIPTINKWSEFVFVVGLNFFSINKEMRIWNVLVLIYLKC